MIGDESLRDVAQRRPPRRIDLERALMRGECDVGSAELILQVAEPREQRLLALRMAPRDRDFASEDHGDALEVIALTPRKLECIERGQVRVTDPQRGFETAHGVVATVGAAE